MSMSKIYEIEHEYAAQTFVRRRQQPFVHPAYLILIVLVVLVGAASVFAWFTAEFSLENRARRGGAKAQYLLGKRYYDQARAPRDYLSAGQWIRKSAEQGYAKAQTALGLLYENGLGVARDYNQAAKWLRRAADQGFPVAQNELGIMYAKGHGFGQNLAQTVHWCRLAAAQGSEIARRNLQLAEVAQARVIPELITAGNKTYKRVRLQKLEADGVTVSFRPDEGGLGVARLKVENLPQELQELCKCADKKGIAVDSAYSQLGAIAS